LLVSADFRSSKVLKNPVSGEVLSAVASGPKSIAIARLNGVGAVDVGELIATQASMSILPAKQ
jgi:hypothetical protein